MDQNKRKFPRVQYPCSLTIWQKKGFDTIMANTLNLGAGGLLVQLDQSLMIGAKVEIKIDFSKEESLHCMGLVLRCQENREDRQGDNFKYNTAIIFEGLDEEKVAHLKRVVDKILTSERND